MGWTARCGRPPLLLPSCRKLEFRLSSLMYSDLAWVNGKSGRQSWCYADAFQRSIISEAIYHLPFNSFVTSLPEMLTWWRGNRKYILRNQRKVVCPILNLPIKSNRHFQWILSYFHGHLTWVCCWHGILVSLFTGIEGNNYWKNKMALVDRK